MRPHFGGFEHSVNWSNLGFVMNIHPTFGDLQRLTNDIVKGIIDGWNNDDAYWNKDRKSTLQQLFDDTGSRTFDPSSFPIYARTDNISARSPNGQNVRSYTVVITTPAKLQRTGKMLMDYIFLTKRVVISAFRKVFWVHNLGWILLQSLSFETHLRIN
jgi:hypothetical protein